MFERFTKDARQVVTGAVAEAERSGDRRVGTDHMLLVVASFASIGADAGELRETRARLEREALAAVGVEQEPIPAFAQPTRPRRLGSTHLPFTGGAKETLKEALREAIRLRHRHIGVEHIALALTTREDRDPAMRLMLAAGIDPSALRRSLLEGVRRAS